MVKNKKLLKFESSKIHQNQTFSPYKFWFPTFQQVKNLLEHQKFQYSKINFLDFLPLLSSNWTSVWLQQCWFKTNVLRIKMILRNVLTNVIDSCKVTAHEWSVSPLLLGQTSKRGRRPQIALYQAISINNAISKMSTSFSYCHHFRILWKSTEFSSWWY